MEPALSDFFFFFKVTKTYISIEFVKIYLHALAVLVTYICKLCLFSFPLCTVLRNSHALLLLL